MFPSLSGARDVILPTSTSLNVRLASAVGGAAHLQIRAYPHVVHPHVALDPSNTRSDLIALSIAFGAGPTFYSELLSKMSISDVSAFSNLTGIPC